MIILSISIMPTDYGEIMMQEITPYINSQTRTNIGWELLSDSTLRTISSIDVSTNPPNVVYLGTSDNYIYRIDNANVGDPEMVRLSNLPIGFGNKNCFGCRN